MNFFPVSMTLSFTVHNSHLKICTGHDSQERPATAKLDYKVRSIQIYKSLYNNMEIRVGGII